MAKSEARKLPKFLLTMVGVLLIVAASIGATLYYSSQGGKLPFTPQPQDATAAQPALAPTPVLANLESVPPPIFVALEPFTVTLRSERSSRILHVAITLRVGDEASRQLLAEYMPEVRDRILRKLGEQHPLQVQTADGRERLVQDITTALQTPYHPRLRSPLIENVLFTAFVVQ